MGEEQKSEELARLEKDVNATIKLILSEMEIAARTPPAEAAHPYECERRRKIIIRAIWSLGRRLRPEEP